MCHQLPGLLMVLIFELPSSKISEKESGWPGSSFQADVSEPSSQTVAVHCRPRPPILTNQEAVSGGHWHLEQRVLLVSRGDMEPWLRGGQDGRSQSLATTSCEGSGHFLELRTILLGTMIHSRVESLHLSAQHFEETRARELWGVCVGGGQENRINCGPWWDAKT